MFLIVMSLAGLHMKHQQVANDKQIHNAAKKRINSIYPSNNITIITMVMNPILLYPFWVEDSGILMYIGENVTNAMNKINDSVLSANFCGSPPGPHSNSNLSRSFKAL